MADINGTLAETLDDSTLAATGVTPVLGSLAALLEDFTSSIAGVVQEPNTADLSVTLDDFTLVATGNIPISGVLALTLDDFQMSATGALPISVPTFGHSLWLTDVSIKYKFTRGN